MRYQLEPLHSSQGSKNIGPSLKSLSAPMNVNDKPSRRTARALMEGNARHATRARDGILRYFGIVLRLSRRNLSEVRSQLYRLRTLHAHTGEQAAHSADLESFFDILRPHDDELGCMDVIFEHLAAGSQQDQSHRGDFLSSGYENRTVNMFEVLALLTIVRHGSLQKKLQMLHELFETSQYCKAGIYFQHDVYHSSQLLGNQPLAEDELAFMIVSISRALALSGISSGASYYSVRRSVAGAVEASGGHTMEDGDTKHGRVTAAQLLVWAHTDPAPLVSKRTSLSSIAPPPPPANKVPILFSSSAGSPRNARYGSEAGAHAAAI